MDRLLNYLFLLILIYIFVLWAPAQLHWMIIAGAVASFFVCALAFLFKRLSLDGASAATVIGTITFGLGGWPVAMALIVFFLSSSIISFGSSAETSVRRNGLQVWANGFWVVFWLVAGMFTNLFICMLAASAAIAAVTADTWATELGSRRFNVATYSAKTFGEVPAGTEGGVSWLGLVASLAGSFFIALIVMFGFSFDLKWFILIIISGFAASLFDSYLGATIQGVSRSIGVSRLNFTKEITVSNNTVNWAASGLGSVLIIILNLLFI